MLELDVSPQADSDLDELWLYIAQDQPVNADRYLAKLLEVARKLADFPGMGRHRPELAEGLRSFPVDGYNLYYRVSGDKLELVRVLSAARDIRQIFPE